MQRIFITVHDLDFECKIRYRIIFITVIIITDNDQAAIPQPSLNGCVKCVNKNKNKASVAHVHNLMKHSDFIVSLCLGLRSVKSDTRINPTQ